MFSKVGLQLHVHIIITQSKERNHQYIINNGKAYINCFLIYLFILCCTDFNSKVNKNVKESLQIVLENVDDNWNVVYEDGEMKVWAAINF